MKAKTDQCQIQPRITNAGIPQVIASAVATEWAERPVREAIELETAVHWLRINLQQKSDVHVFDLERKDLFSNRASDKILIYENDFLVDDKRYREADPAHLGCYLEELRGLVEANGRTRFLVLVVPDKYTVYRGFIPGQDARKNLFDLLEEEGLPLIRFDRIFEAQANAGLQDLYLPNDSHWGSEGSRLFASVVASALLPEQGTEEVRQFSDRQASGN